MIEEDEDSNDENAQVDSKTCVNVNEVNIADNAGKITFELLKLLHT